MLLIIFSIYGTNILMRKLIVQKKNYSKHWALTPKASLTATVIFPSLLDDTHRQSLWALILLTFKLPLFSLAIPPVPLNPLSRYTHSHSHSNPVTDSHSACLLRNSDPLPVRAIAFKSPRLSFCTLYAAFLADFIVVFTWAGCCLGAEK